MSASQFKKIIDRVQERIIDLCLEDLEESQIRAWRRKELRGGQIEPGVTLSLVRVAEGRGTNQREDIGYGVLVLLADPSYGEMEIDDTTLLWEQEIRQEFIHQQLTDADDNVLARTCTLESPSGEQFNASDFENGDDVTAFVLRFWIRESRNN